MINKGMRPVHPGEILLEEFMKPSEPPINANTLAKALEVPANRITAITKDSGGSPAIRPCVSQPSLIQPLSFG
jgi:antitoxin HigA-1